ncbi:MAG: D-glycero-D-manno-heptose 1-phosphate guanosyltransferase, partial [Planctomycetota bacterium]
MKEAVILAGGLGTRLRSVVSGIPKPMAQIRNKPFLSYLLDNLDQAGFHKVILAVGYQWEKIRDFFHEKY